MKTLRETYDQVTEADMKTDDEKKFLKNFPELKNLFKNFNVVRVEIEVANDDGNKTFTFKK